MHIAVFWGVVLLCAITFPAHVRLNSLHAGAADQRGLWSLGFPFSRVEHGESSTAPFAWRLPVRVYSARDPPQPISIIMTLGFVAVVPALPGSSQITPGQGLPGIPTLPSGGKLPARGWSTSGSRRMLTTRNRGSRHAYDPDCTGKSRGKYRTSESVGGRRLQRDHLPWAVAPGALHSV